MNQDFTVKKKQYLSEKKIRAEGFTWKKKFLHKPSVHKHSLRTADAFPVVASLTTGNASAVRRLAQAGSEKKIRARWKFPPPITFLMVRP